jgi:DNA end-binding protein Ku
VATRRVRDTEGMARPIWTGTISFGLVTVPVKLYSAVSRKTVRFHQLHESTGARIQQKRVDPQTGEEVPYDEIVKGYEIAPDRYVIVKPDELEALDPKKTRTIEIEDFVDLDDIDPIFYDHPYYLAPGPGGAKPYRLLLEAMRETNKVAIARVVIRSKENLVAIRPMGDVLGMTTMIFADEVIDPERIDDMPDPDEVGATDRELDIAKQLVESLAGDFQPDKYHDSYREEVLSLIERKAAGEEISVQAPREEEEEPVPDLMSALKASLDAVRSSDSGSGGGSDAGAGKGNGSGQAKKPARATSPSRAKSSSAKSSSSGKSSGAKSPSRAKAKK